MQSDSFRELYNLLVETLGQEQVVALFQAATIRGLIGTVLGLALSFAAYRGFRHLRWYGGTSTAGRWAQRSIFIVVTLITMLLVGAAGLWQGVRRQSQTAITRSHLGTNALPAVADLIAECLVWVDLAAERQDSATKAETDARLKAFRNGSWELNAPAFLQRFDSLRTDLFQEVLVNFENAVLNESPKLKGGAVEKILHYLIHNLGTALLEKKLLSEMQRKGVDQIYQAIRTRLIAEAALSGNPATISRAELSAFLLREGIIPAIVTPIRSFARQQQIIYLLIAVFACLAPPAICRLCQRKPSSPPDNNAGFSQ